MFALLLTLVGDQIVGPVPSEPAVTPKVTYTGLMLHNAADGQRFVKPARGKEDGCIKGLCAESHAGQYADRVAPAAADKLPCHWGWC